MSYFLCIVLINGSSREFNVLICMATCNKMCEITTLNGWDMARNSFTQWNGWLFFICQVIKISFCKYFIQWQFCWSCWNCWSEGLNHLYFMLKYLRWRYPTTAHEKMEKSIITVIKGRNLAILLHTWQLLSHFHSFIVSPSAQMSH